MDILDAYTKVDDVVTDIQEIRDDVEKEFDVWYEASETLAEIVRSSEKVRTFPVFADVSHFARTYRLIHQSNTI